MTETFKPLDRLDIARRIAQDIPEGWFVNLGIGMPTTVSDYVPPDREVIFHAENGVIGIGPAPAPEDVNPYLVNAGVQPITLRVGAALIHHADSFAIARGGHLDLCVLGAFQVAANGDLANWTHGPDEPTKQVGGAMDLAVGAKRVWIAMEHTTRQGHPRLLERCLYPLTAAGVVKRVYTDLAVIDVTPRGFEVREMIAGLDFETLQARTGAVLHRLEDAA
jgi:3-oxoadipate CoA-transferase beta subunit